MLFVSKGYLFAQSITIVRTDVDTARASFITAGYVFGIDIKVVDGGNFNGVSFELDWDAPNDVKFSQWKVGPIGIKSQAFVVDKISQDGNIGEIVAGIGTGFNLDTTVTIDTTVIHLDFVTLQSAAHAEDITFSFVNPAISYEVNNTKKIVILKSTPTVFKTHSYVNVYPGDADNNGIVDHLDFVNVTLYMGMGPMTKNLRTFKRTYPSSYWVAQQALAWDVENATYADCDGNGEITVKDMLIVSYNIGDMWTAPSGIIKPKDNFPEIFADKSYPKDAIYIPINVSAFQHFLSATCSIKFKDPNLADKIIGIKAGEFFDSPNAFTYYVKNNDELQFFVGNTSKEINKKQEGILAYLVFPNDVSINSSDFNIEEASAISENGLIFNINPLTSVNFASFDNSNLKNTNMQLNYSDNLVNIKLPSDDYIKTLQLVDLNGRLIRSLTSNNHLNQIGLDLTGLSPSVYILSVQSESGKYYTETILFFH